MEVDAYAFECSAGCEDGVVDRTAGAQEAQTKSAVIRDAIGALAKQEEQGAGKKRPYDLVAHLIGCVKGGPRDLSVRTGEKFRQMLVERSRKRRRSSSIQGLWLR